MKRSATSLASALLVVAVSGSATGASTAATETAYRAGIYSVREDGTDRQLIALPDPPVSSLIRSPGGRLILFTREVDGVPALFAAERSGANAVRLTPPDFHAGAYVGGASFSPDGLTVAFTSYDSCGFRCVRSNLYLVGRYASDLRLVAEGASEPS